MAVGGVRGRAVREPSPAARRLSAERLKLHRKESAMRSAPAIVAAALGAMVLASGCGQQQQGAPAGPSRPVSATAARRPGGPGTGARCGTPAPPISLITITYADNGRTLCVR